MGAEGKGEGLCSGTGVREGAVGGTVGRGAVAQMCMWGAVC